MKIWHRWIQNISLAAEQSARYSEGHFRLLGWLAWLIPVAAVVDYVVGNPSYDTILIRTSAAVVCIPLILHRKLPARLSSLKDWYFVFVTAYCFPFTYGFMLAMNAAHAPLGQEIHIIWILQYFIALFLFIQLIVNGSLATLLWVIASCFALLPALIYPEANTAELKRVFVYPITGYLTALGFGILTNRKTAIINAEKAAAASAIGANLAHELRTPLASIGALAKGTENFLPTLTDAYQKAKNAGIELQPLRENQVSLLRKSLSTIRNEVDYSNTIIDMLLVNTADKSLSDVETDFFSVREAATESMQRFPFNNQRERELVELDIANDFEVEAPRLLIVHVLFNLIKNALYSVQKAGKGEIKITAEHNSSGGRILVHDSGIGIPASVRAHIFERFYTTTQTIQSAGIGLSFCKLVMESIGGSIRCDSVEGKYTTFTLEFPSARELEQPSA